MCDASRLFRSIGLSLVLGIFSFLLLVYFSALMEKNSLNAKGLEKIRVVTETSVPDLEGILGESELAEGYNREDYSRISSSD